MEQFAQTRAPDDLFDDDFTPVQAPVEEPTPEPPVPSAPRDRGGRSRGGAQHERGSRGRGRGRGRDRERGAEEPQEKPVVPQEEVEGDGDAEKEEKPTDARENGKPEAVRGDRSGTGGVRKPKLSEDELTERLASIKLKNAAREAAHARAEADEASFHQREQHEKAKRIEERQNRREMDSEREKNRQRKMKAVQGREWDAEKKDEDLSAGRGRGSQFRRGAYGGVSRDDGYAGAGQDASPDISGYTERGRGRGGRGGRGRGRERGDGVSNSATSRGSNNSSAPAAAPDTNADTAFPSLPAAKPPSPEKAEPQALSLGTDGANDEIPPAEKATDHTAQKPAEIPLISPHAEAGTWADQVEAGQPATPAAESTT